MTHLHRVTQSYCPCLTKKMYCIFSIADVSSTSCVEAKPLIEFVGDILNRNGVLNGITDFDYVKVHIFSVQSASLSTVPRQVSAAVVGSSRFNVS